MPKAQYSVATGKNGKKKGGRKSSAGVAFTARLVTIGESGPTYLTVTDKRSRHVNKSWNVDVNCLVCHELIEQAIEEPSSNVRTSPKTAPLDLETISLPSREVAPEAKKEEQEDSVMDAIDSPPRDPLHQPERNGETTEDPPSA
jgi:hypothetical protein